MNPKHSVWQDLVTAMLAVYQYSLEKVDSFAPGLREAGLFEPENLAQYEHEEIFTRLEQAGYKRGELNAIFTDRLRSMGAYVMITGKTHCETVLSGEDKQALEKLLKPIKGVGPKVIENFFTLRGL